MRGRPTDGQHGACVLRPTSPSSAISLPQSFARLNARGEIDIGRTRELLEESNANGAFRKIASTFGVFAFDGEYYMDLFDPGTGNLEEQYQRGRTVSELLQVLHRKNGVSTLSCEIRWYDRPQP
jgi:hypothetical protein